jgi:hypothetical protein
MKTKLSDYTPEEVARYTHMHIVLTAYNDNYGTNDEMPAPNYSDKEMAAMSIYFALVLQEKAKGRIT